MLRASIRLGLILQRLVYRVSKRLPVTPAYFRRRALIKGEAIRVFFDLTSLPFLMRIRFATALVGVPCGIARQLLSVHSNNKVLSYQPATDFISAVEECSVRTSNTHLGKAKVEFIKDGYVVGPFINRRLWRSSMPVARRTEKMGFASLEAAIPNLVPMVGPTAHNFGHFLLEHTTQLALAEQHFQSLKNLNILLSDDIPWQREILRFIGILDSQIHIQKGGAIGRPLLVGAPNPVYMREMEVRIERLNWLRHKLMIRSKSITSGQGSESVPIVLLDRSATGRRAISNAPALRKAVMQRGGTVIDPVSLNPTTSALLFRGNQLVISTIGSGVLNVLFSSQTATKVLLLANGYFPPHVFLATLQASGVQVSCFTSKPEGYRRLNPSAPVAVDIRRMEAAMDDFLSRERSNSSPKLETSWEFRQNHQS